MRLGLAFILTTLFGCASASPPSAKTTSDGAQVAAPAAPRAALTEAQIVAEVAKTQRLARAERIAIWRKWAADPAERVLVMHALAQLAWAEDSDVVMLSTRALESAHHDVRAVAARALVHVGKADKARSELLEVLAVANERDRAAIVWALVVAGEKTTATAALDELRKGTLAKVTRLDGGIAFDTMTLGALFSAEELAGLAKDNHPTVRQLAASALAIRAESKWTETLVQLLGDADDAVYGAAAGGLARITTTGARDALFKALQNADAQRRHRLLEGIRDLAGAPGLVAVLGSIQDKPPEATWFQSKQIFDMLRASSDPRIGDALVAWAAGKGRHAHWLGEAGLRLAEVGDVRGAKLLGDRLRIDPSKLYSIERFWEADEGGHLSRTDLPRIVSARLLADLAMIHPDKHAELKAAAEDAMLFWINDRPQPHANGMRFLAAVRSDKVLKDLRAWAFPTDPLPSVGASPPFPQAFETAQMGLRYIGMWRDEPSFSKLLDQLQRKQDKKLDITLEGLMDGDMAMLGMTLRALGYGAAQGLAHFRDPRAVRPLMTFIEDETWHEEARQSACEALAWCADGKTIADVAKKAAEFGGKSDPRKQLIGVCYAQTLAIAPAPDAVPMLVDLLGPNLNRELRVYYARAIGAAGFDAQTESKLVSKLQNPETRLAAALALVMGGNAETATRTVATSSDFGKEFMNELRDQYYRALGFWTHADFERGNVYRWVTNAEAISRVEIAGALQTWALQRLQSQFDNLRFDNGPHSLTRPFFLHRLYQDAKMGNAARKVAAIKTLQLMKEQGVLWALRDELGETGALARKALHECKNPVPIPGE